MGECDGFCLSWVEMFRGKDDGMGYGGVTPLHPRAPSYLDRCGTTATLDDHPLPYGVRNVNGIGGEDEPNEIKPPQARQGDENRRVHHIRHGSCSSVCRSASSSSTS